MPRGLVGASLLLLVSHHQSCFPTVAMICLSCYPRLTQPSGSLQPCGRRSYCSSGYVIRSRAIFLKHVSANVAQEPDRQICLLVRRFSTSRFRFSRWLWLVSYSTSVTAHRSVTMLLENGPSLSLTKPAGITLFSIYEGL